MNYIIAGILGAVGGLLINFLYSKFNKIKPDMSLQSSSIHQFKVPSLTGETIDFAAFKGKEILVVNTASKCGYTPQYEGLEALYKKYQDRLVIVGFPCNDFLFQEPGDAASIAAFCEKNYGVSFPLAGKIHVKGKDMAPIYQWLTHKELNGVSSSEVSWNFQKYLLDEEGRLIRHFEPKIEPNDPEIIALIAS